MAIPLPAYILPDLPENYLELISAAPDRPDRQAPGRPAAKRSIFPVRRLAVQLEPTALQGRNRRRRDAWLRLVNFGPLPPTLIADLTVPEVAIAGIIGMEAARSGSIATAALSIDEYADRAQTSRSVVKRALRKFVRIGAVLVTERPRPGQPNATNLVRIISRDWLAWIRTRRFGGRGPGPDRLRFQVDKREGKRRSDGPADKAGRADAPSIGGRPNPPDLPQRPARIT
jgi:hypothetical protein